MKSFYGSISFSGKIKFYIEAETEGRAREIVVNDIEGLDVNLKENSEMEISEIEWGLIEEAQRGNASEPYISDMEIYEDD